MVRTTNTRSIIFKLKQNKHLSELFTPTSAAQFKKYLVIGVSCFVLEYSLFLLLLDYVKLGEVLSNPTAGLLVSNTLVYTLMFWLNFIFNRIWSFQSKDSFIRQLKLYTLLYSINQVVMNISFMYVLTNLLTINERIAKVFIMGTIMLWNFIIYKKIIYR